MFIISQLCSTKSPLKIYGFSLEGQPIKLENIDQITELQDSELTNQFYITNRARLIERKKIYTCPWMSSQTVR